MKLKGTHRYSLFNEGRRIHPTLGDVFQNPIELKREYFNDESVKIDLLILDMESYRKQIIALREMMVE